MENVRKVAALSAMTAMLTLAGCSASSYVDGLVAQAEADAEISAAPPNGAEWTSGILVCPYTPLEHIPEAYRSQFSENDLPYDHTQWLGFTTAQGVEVVKISRRVFEFCWPDNATAFEPGHTWTVTKDSDGRILASDRQALLNTPTH